ncbi:MAG: hypothetical protein ACRDZN_03055 [Acidimicrobiales bacterium]
MYATHGRRVLAYALRRTSQPTDAADVLAEVLVEHVVPDPAESAGTAAAVRAPAAQLPEGDREVLLLAGWEGQTATPDRSGARRPPARVRTRLHRARGLLRATLAEHLASAGHEGGDERPLVRDHEDQP